MRSRTSGYAVAVPKETSERKFWRRLQSKQTGPQHDQVVESHWVAPPDLSGEFAGYNCEASSTLAVAQFVWL